MNHPFHMTRRAGYRPQPSAEIRKDREMRDFNTMRDKLEQALSHTTQPSEKT